MAVLLVLVAALLAAVPAQAQETTVPSIDRIAGDDRIQTAIAISQEAFESADVAVVARSDVYADALAGGPLAAALGGPMLLADDLEDLEAGVLDELDRLGVGRVYVLGGSAAVPIEVVNALADVAAVSRLAGSDRFATAQRIIRVMDDLVDVTTVVVVKGRDAVDSQQGFADAMSAAWWAGQQGYAIAPVLSDAVPAGHVEVLEDVGAASAYVVGGPAAVSEDVVTALADAGLEVTARLGGADRYETSAIVWSTGVAQGADPTARWVARGDIFPDALSAGPAVAAAGYTFALVHPADLARSPASVAVLAGSPEHLDAVRVLGGTQAVSTDVAAQIEALLSDPELGDAAYCLTVLHNNDGESQLVASANDAAFGGVARFESVVERERELAASGFDGDGCGERQSITLNSGDNYLPGAEFEASAQGGFEPFYDSLALEAVGYDAFAVGNHEFDFGPQVLATFIESFEGSTPFVSVNLETDGTVLDGLIEPSVLIDKGRTIGVIGASPTNLAQISSPGEVGVMSFDETVAAVNAEAAQLRSDGADIVVLQSHLQNINSDLALIEQTSGIDIAIAGGGDELLGSYGNLYLPAEATQALPQTIGSEETPVAATYPVLTPDADGQVVPIVTTTGDYEYVGRLRARFDDDDLVGFDARRSRLIRVVDDAYAVDGVEPDAALQETVVDPVAAFVDQFRSQVIGTTEVGLNGVRTDVRTRQTNVGSLLTDSYIYAVAQSDAGLDTTEPTVAIANGGGIRNDSIIPVGNLTVGDVIDIAPFGNTVVAHDGVTADQLLPLLEHGVSGLPDAEGRFSQVGGLTMQVDTSQTAQVVGDDGQITTEGDRVRSVTLTGPEPDVVLVEDGDVVDDTTTFNLATVNFTADGGDNYPFAAVGLAPDDYVQVSPDYRQALQTFVEVGLGGTVTSEAYPDSGRIAIDAG